MSTTTARTVELDITNVAHGGVFVARHEGRVVFVPDTLPGERVRARIVGWSAGGTGPGYRYHALSAHPGIEDAAVASPRPGLVVVSLLPRTGTDGEAALAAATERLQDPSVRALTDMVEVRLASAVPVSVSARI